MLTNNYGNNYKKKIETPNNSKIPASRVSVLRCQEIRILKSDTSQEIHRFNPALRIVGRSMLF